MAASVAASVLARVRRRWARNLCPPKVCHRRVFYRRISACLKRRQVSRFFSDYENRLRACPPRSKKRHTIIDVYAYLSTESRTFRLVILNFRVGSKPVGEVQHFASVFQGIRPCTRRARIYACLVNRRICTIAEATTVWNRDPLSDGHDCEETRLRSHRVSSR